MKQPGLPVLLVLIFCLSLRLIKSLNLNKAFAESPGLLRESCRGESGDLNSVCRGAYAGLLASASQNAVCYQPPPEG